MTRRLCVAALAAFGATLVAGSAASGTGASTSAYYVARADPRLCPSPMCGGIWVDRVNHAGTICGDDARRRECYAAEADLSRLRVDEKGRVQLQASITEGRAVARGRLVPGLVDGFPELDIFVVSEVWLASSSRNRARGTFLRLRDNGVRCVTTPCFSIRATRLNHAAASTVSDVDLGHSGAPRAEQQRALGAIARPGVIVAGRILRTLPGREVVATQFYTHAT